MESENKNKNTIKVKALKETNTKNLKITNLKQNDIIIS